MLDIQKWNYKKHEYEPFEVPEGRRVMLYTDFMGQPIDCTNCGKNMVFGDGYTSRVLHNSIGFGYPVCEDCHKHEVDVEKEAQHDD